MKRCKSCDAEIEWARSSATNRPMPLDIAPSANGNIVVRDGIAHVHQAGSTIMLSFPIDQRRVSHFATCVHAAQWRQQ